jgi:hypothetical protein
MAGRLRHDRAMTTPGLDLLGPIQRTPRPRASNLLVALTAAGSIAVAGAGIATAAVLGSGGAQPEDVLPRNTIGMVKVDLDPAADQKVAAYRLGRKFPDLEVKGEDSVLSDLVRQAVNSSGDLDYAQDVEPWLGKRAAAAVVPDAEDDFALVFAVQVTDRGKAEKGLKKLAEDEPFGYAFAPDEDYVLIAEKQAQARSAAGAAQHLADSEGYADAVDELDGNQIVTAWVDVAAAVAAAPDEVSTSLGGKPAGYVVAGIHLDASYVELSGKTIGVTTGEEQTIAGREPVRLVQDLPDDTVVGVGMTGLAEVLQKSLTKLEGPEAEMLRDAESELGVSLSKDLPAVVGEELAGAVLGSADGPAFVARSRSKNAEQGFAVIQRMLAKLPPEQAAQTLVRRTPDGLVAGSDAAAIDRVLNGGALGDSDAFHKAVPDAGEAGFIVYVDVTRALDLFAEDLGNEPARAAKQVRAVGITATTSEGGNGSFRFRVTFR